MRATRYATALAPYAATPDKSRGRCFRETEHPYRNCFERDRDRIIHSRAFRRLEYKTQVFPNYEGDHFRTRLTHTIEVAQLARTVASALGLNRTLAEAIALAHDLGHPPFGHVGEEALDELLVNSGGFEHNRQALRVVDDLEERYAAFRGLNLTYEVREGIAKHTTRYDRYQADELSAFRIEDQPLIEAQLIDWVDRIAYCVHDLDDGFEANILVLDDLREAVPFLAAGYEGQRQRLPDATARQLLNESLRAAIDWFVTDLIDTTDLMIDSAGIDGVAAVRCSPEPLVRLGATALAHLDEIADFLHQRLYRCTRVADELMKARLVLIELFNVYRDDTTLLPPRYRERCRKLGEDIAIADYVAGMTDRFALKEHRRLVEGTP